ncbi:MAG: hypothetical protein LC647_10055, partial [Beggiatoa sp.]|nr:hypothetical protein [Beggiatoa sp.]
YGRVGCRMREGTFAQFVPESYHQYPTHLDPEFETFTYGDIRSPRASNLSRAKVGDQLWFLARLWDHDGERWLSDSAFYFIGLFVVEKNLLVEENTDVSNLASKIKERIQQNAHYLRLLRGDQSEFRVICGDFGHSRRFRRGLQVSPEVAGYIYGGEWSRALDQYTHRGKVLLNNNGRPRTYATFGSVTRSIQAFLDSENPGDEPYLQALSTAAAECF